jgi:hypothetical protein
MTNRDHQKDIDNLHLQIDILKERLDSSVQLDLEVIGLLRELWINTPVIVHALLMYREAREEQNASTKLAHLATLNIQALSKWSKENIVCRPVDKS